LTTASVDFSRNPAGLIWYVYGICLQIATAACPDPLVMLRARTLGSRCDSSEMAI
jgi:hypothetical protein